MDNLRRFVIVITVFMFFTISVCGFLLSLGYSGISKGKEIPVKIDGADKYDWESPDNYLTDFSGNILFLIGEKSRPELDAMFILNYNSTKSQMTFLFIPKDLKYSISKTTDTIGGYYSLFGGEETALLVSSLLDIGISHYVNLNDNSFARMINMFEGVSFNLPVDIEYNDENYKIDLKKGEKIFDGSMALQLNQFYKTNDNSYSSNLLSFYNGNDVNRIKMVKNFSQAFVNQKINDKYKDKYFDYFNLLLKDCDTNINEQTLQSITYKLDKIDTKSVEYYMITGKEVINDKYSIEYKDLFLNLNSNLNVNSFQILENRFIM